MKIGGAGHKGPPMPTGPSGPTPGHQKPAEFRPAQQDGMVGRAQQQRQDALQKAVGTSPTGVPEPIRGQPGYQQAVSHLTELMHSMGTNQGAQEGLHNALREMKQASPNTPSQAILQMVNKAAVQDVKSDTGELLQKLDEQKDLLAQLQKEEAKLADALEQSQAKGKDGAVQVEYNTSLTGGEAAAEGAKAGGKGAAVSGVETHSSESIRGQLALIREQMGEVKGNITELETQTTRAAPGSESQGSIAEMHQRILEEALAAMSAGD